MAKKTLKNIIIRYGVATFGLILVAIGVALSLKSNLGTAPVSCPPAVLNLKWGAISVGTFTWMMHIIFILTQMILLGRKFKAEYLMQIPAAFVFGYLCDAAIWACQGIPAATYAARMALCLASVLLTAVGIHIEVVAGAWILAGDKLTDVIAQVTGTKFSNVKIVRRVRLAVVPQFLRRRRGHRHPRRHPDPGPADGALHETDRPHRGPAVLPYPKESR